MCAQAILRVLWQLYPEHPHLLRTELRLTPELKATGYVKKPIDGHGGHDIIIVPADQVVAKATAEDETGGANWVYQELCSLPKFLGGAHNVQVLVAILVPFLICVSHSLMSFLPLR